MKRLRWEVFNLLFCLKDIKKKIPSEMVKIVINSINKNNSGREFRPEKREGARQQFNIFIGGNFF